MPFSHRIDSLSRFSWRRVHEKRPSQPVLGVSERLFSGCPEGSNVLKEAVLRVLTVSTKVTVLTLLSRNDTFSQDP